MSVSKEINPDKVNKYLNEAIEACKKSNPEYGWIDSSYFFQVVRNQTLDAFVAELEMEATDMYEDWNTTGKFVSLAVIKQTAQRMKGEG